MVEVKVKEKEGSNTTIRRRDWGSRVEESVGSLMKQTAFLWMAPGTLIEATVSM